MTRRSPFTHWRLLRFLAGSALVASLLGTDIDVFERGQLIATSRRQGVRTGAVPRLLAPQARVAIELEDIVGDLLDKVDLPHDQPDLGVVVLLA